jgi:hypothetical protein
MSNFETELRALIEEWTARGADAGSMTKALREEAQRLGGDRKADDDWTGIDRSGLVP